MKLHFVLIVGLALSGCAVFDRPPPDGPAFYQDLTKPNASLDKALATSMISEYRTNNGLSPIRHNPTLSQIAQNYAREMAARDKMGHSVDGTTLQQRVEGGGYMAMLAGENVAAGYLTLAEAFSGWRESRPHRVNMLKPNVSEMGIAAVHRPGSKYRMFWVLIVAEPERKVSQTTIRANPDHAAIDNKRAYFTAAISLEPPANL